MKERDRRKSRTGGTCIKSQSPSPGGVQLSIMDYYRSSKAPNMAKDKHNMSQNEETGLTEKSKASSTSLPKSVRRRLLFS